MPIEPSLALPIDVVGEKFSNEPLVIWLQFFGVGHFVSLGIKVVRVERPNSIEHLVVPIIHKIRVCAFAVPRVERVISNHGKTFFR